MKKNSDKLSEAKKNKDVALSAERREVLSMPPGKALDAILEHPYPVTFVQSMAEEDLYMLVHTIGPDDALPILGLASNDQWRYFLDMEVWARDRIDPVAATQWLDRLMRADADRFTHWIVNEQADLFSYYLQRNIELYVRENEDDPADIGDGFFTEDDVHFVRLRPYPDLGEENNQAQEVRDLFVKDVLKRLSIFSYPFYQGLLLQTTAIIPSELEEEELRLRDMRLAEKGFLPFDEAVGIYQPLGVAELLNRVRKGNDTGGRAVETYPLPAPPDDGSAEGSLFATILARMGDDLELQRLQMEFASLCNQVISADQRRISEKEALSQIVDKVAGYISIGLEQVDREAGKADPYHGANMLRNHLLADIFRVGYGCALALKWRAERWRRGSWFGRSGLPLSFWGESGMGVLGGLLIKKPLYFDNYASGVLYREFATLADIHHTERLFEEIIAYDDLIALMGIEVPPFKANTFLTYQNLLLTLWAVKEVSPEQDDKVLRLLRLPQLKRFYGGLWEKDATPRHIKAGMRERFLGWAAERSGLSTYEVAERMGAALEGLFRQIESELGSVDVEALDPRYLQLFLLSVEE